MIDIFNDTCRRFVTERCAAFRRMETGASDMARTADTTGASGALKHAAVAIVVTEADNPADGAAFLLTRRAPRMRAHAGQWALPGGRCDKGETAIDAALRELDEEIGLKLTPRNVLGILDDYPTRSGYLITPVVLWGGPGISLSLNPDEVAAVYRIPLKDIEPDDVLSFITIPQSKRPVIRLRIMDDFIHAPTAAMLYQFREVLAGRETRVDHLEQPLFAWR